MGNQLQKIVGMKKEDFDVFVNEKKEILLQPVRLIPTTKPGDEVALTSIFLSGLCLIKEFRDLVFTEIKLSKVGTIYAYTEIIFTQFNEVRFDGLVLIVRGGLIKEAAIFEMKNKNNTLDKNQIEAYTQIVKQLQITKLVSVSNQFVSIPTQYPITVKTPKNVELYHFSWSYILTLAHILLFDNDLNIEDNDQITIMKEIVTYLEHPIAGVCGFTKMKAGWKETVDKINTGSRLKLADQCVIDAVTSWQQEEKDLALILSRKLGLLIKSGSTKYKNDLQLRIDDDKKSLIHEKELVSTLKISGAVSDLTISALFEKRTIEMSVKLIVPLDKKVKGQLGFIKRQLEKCLKKGPEKFQQISDDLVVGINIKRAKGIDRYSYRNIENIYEEIKYKEINDARIILIKDFGKTFSSSIKFVEILEGMLIDFYKVIVQHLTRWEKPAPKIKEQEINQEK